MSNILIYTREGKYGNKQGMKPKYLSSILCFLTGCFFIGIEGSSGYQGISWIRRRWRRRRKKYRSTSESESPLRSLEAPLIYLIPESYLYKKKIHINSDQFILIAPCQPCYAIQNKIRGQWPWSQLSDWEKWVRKEYTKMWNCGRETGKSQEESGTARHRGTGNRISTSRRMPAAHQPNGRILAHIIAALKKKIMKMTYNMQFLHWPMHCVINDFIGVICLGVW